MSEIIYCLNCSADCTDEKSINCYDCGKSVCDSCVCDDDVYGILLCDECFYNRLNVDLGYGG